MRESLVYPLIPAWSEFACAENSTCENFSGGYFCQCNEGFHENDGECQDVNECSLEGKALFTMNTTFLN